MPHRCRDSTGRISYEARFRAEAERHRIANAEARLRAEEQLRRIADDEARPEAEETRRFKVVGLPVMRRSRSGGGEAPPL